MIRKDIGDYCDGFASKTTSEKRGKREQRDRRATNQPSSSSTIANLRPIHLLQEHIQECNIRIITIAVIIIIIFIFIYIYIIIIITVICPIEEAPKPQPSFPGNKL